MEKPKFTPGPWKVHHHKHITGEHWLPVLRGAWDVTHGHAADPGVVASADYSAMSDAENLANARLIAAAPDLKTFAAAWVRFVEATFAPINADAGLRELDDEHNLTITVEQFREFYADSRAALSKAEGREGEG